jgi:hypothetical protein
MQLFNVLLISAFALMAFSPNGKNDKPKFPKYDPILTLPGGSCSCSGVFTSCSKSCSKGDCDCTCGVFTCSCTGCKIQAAMEIYPISVNEAQYAKINKLANILYSENDEISVKSYYTLIEMIGFLKTKNYSEYDAKAKLLQNTLLSSLPKKVKGKINTTFKSDGFQI